MKNSVLIFTLAVSTLLSGCRKDEENGIEQTSKLIAKASNEIVATFASAADLRASVEADEPIIFTGNDILWFDGATGEIRFRDNMANTNSLSLWRSVKFYIGDDYLFSSMIFVSDLSSAIYNSLVFYYSIIENKFYLADGYPMDTSVLSDPQKAQDERDDNMRKIENEWNKFITLMKQEEKYR
ncbi:MAG: hypothetical protein LBR84_08310 [Tannerella sp.]|jgi:hypothetical protein|nr:hypothetical protein [Tannerella sp.]